MSKLYYICLFVLLLGFSSTIQAQPRICGNTYADQMSQIDRFLANKKMASARPAKSRNEMNFIPLKLHIVTKSDGSGQVKIMDILEQMCSLNTLYGEFGMQFYLTENIDFLPSNIIYDNHTATSSQFTMRQRRDREAINIWVVNDASPASALDIGLTLGYYDPPNDWIILKKDQVNYASNTLAHELGHFFSLNHPHFGWDAEPYDPSIHGNPVIATAPDGRSTELMDGSNCEDAGDMLCDTPPDYNFGLSFAGCTYNGNIKDPNGTTVDPDETLIMSYFTDQCTDKFTESQIDIMLADYESPGRFFLRASDYVPVTATITAKPTLISPINNDTTPAYNKVTLKWNAAAGAQSYLLEIDRSSGFNIDNFKFITTATSFLVEDILDAGKSYRWRVTPFNETYTCATPSETGKFTTGISVGVPTITQVNDWSIQPNPSIEQSFVNIIINANESFEAAIKVFSLTGQMLQVFPEKNITAGRTSFQIPTDNLEAGIYFINLESSKGLLNKKLIIL